MKLTFHDGIVAIILLGSTLVTRKIAPRRVLLEAAAWGFVLFVLPTMLAEGAGGSIRSSTELLTLGLVPFLTVFLLAQRDGGEMGLLVPAAAGLGGLALLAQFSLPSTGRGMGWLALVVLAVGLIAAGGIGLNTILRGVPLIPAAAAASVGAALGGGVGAFLIGRLESSGPISWDVRTLGVECAWAVGIDLPLTLLAVWLLREMRPTAFATRLLLIPMLTVLEGIVVIRPSVMWTTWLGLVLLAGASWVLLAEPNQSVGLTSLR